VTRRRAHGQLEQTAGKVVGRVADRGAGTVLVGALRAIDGAAEHVDVRIDAHAAEYRAEAAILVGAVGAGHVDAPALTGTQDVLDVLGAERHHAADRAGAVDVRGRAAHHVDAADEFRIEEERAVGVMTGALIVLPRAVDDDCDTAEILQAADVDDSRGIVAAFLKDDAGDVVEDVGEPVRLQALDLLQRHHRNRRQRVDRFLFGLRSRNGDGVERLHGIGAGLRIRIHDRGRGSLRLLLGLRRLLLRLLRLLLLRRASDASLHRLRPCRR
jgi:hypothetical protein